MEKKTKKMLVIEWLKTNKISNVSEAYKAFKKEKKIKISKVYFSRLFKEQPKAIKRVAKNKEMFTLILAIKDLSTKLKNYEKFYGRLQKTLKN